VLLWDLNYKVNKHVDVGMCVSIPIDCGPWLIWDVACLPMCGRFDSVIQPCWHEKASKRPNFSTICNAIDEFRHGGDTQTGYYAPNEGQGTAETAIYDDGR